MPLNEPDAHALRPLMNALLDDFEPLHRLSGCQDAEQAADQLLQRLSALGMTPVRERCTLFLSDPLAASLELMDFPLWTGKVKTRSFSAHCPDGVSGALFYDKRSLEEIADRDRARWEASVKGKIVIADQGFEDYVQRLNRAGALGLIHIWGSAEEALHEETVGPVWGTPVPDDEQLYPTIPVISVNQAQGQELLEMLTQQAGDATARMTTELHEHVAQCSLPVVEIPGERDEFVLLSSHYDSWHEGLTDNATGNALCLAVAAHFFSQRASLKRGLRIAWWPGHSNARYGGSTWYADRYRQLLQQKCVAHINVDSPGCRDATRIVINASGAEAHGFLHQAVYDVTGFPAKRITPPGKGGDQSFWGCGIPLHIAFREEPEVKSSHSPGSGGGWWWHTEADTRDKVDNDLLWRDTQIHIAWLSHMLGKDALPYAPDSYLTQLLSELDGLQNELDPQFALSTIKEALLALRCQLQEITWENSEVGRQVIGQAIALWHRVRYISTDDFHYDRSYRGGAWPGLQVLRGQLQQNSSARAFLMMTTQFTRQRDRTLSLLSQSSALLETLKS
ncbi:M28 family metallopeptidase [Erwinia oleae]|uniref:M28 family metallopeptidase n=1 Tax=Erwinia oleae TaxID=796334 RepID=UPI000557AA87|nr:M28 family metallopeptidase [Erwinia oleae]